MEAAEDEMETALKRTGEVQKSQVARKDLEVQELRRVVSSKEKSIDGLRETLAATKRSLEARLLAMETTVAARDAEVRQLQEGLVTVKAERDHLQYELQQEVLRTSRVDKEHQGREEDMAGALNALQENMSQAEASLRQERKAKEKLAREVEELKVQWRITKQKVKWHQSTLPQHTKELHWPFCRHCCCHCAVARVCQ
ncbi:unnamed protein product [Ostreobium quekettii]|uniref:Uncharacterized protein n=1 Tax=Ostreobium quekettii TaxID=121088 RepID=A0A8S1J308_9CHLO|nr:unnamed protein product [Ostreobium quekettii]